MLDHLDEDKCLQDQEVVNIQQGREDQDCQGNHQLLPDSARQEDLKECLPDSLQQESVSQKE